MDSSGQIIYQHYFEGRNIKCVVEQEITLFTSSLIHIRLECGEMEPILGNQSNKPRKWPE